MVDVLCECFKKRAGGIADHAMNPRGALGEGMEFLQGLDEGERACMFVCFGLFPCVRCYVD